MEERSPVGSKPGGERATSSRREGKSRGRHEKIGRRGRGQQGSPMVDGEQALPADSRTRDDPPSPQSLEKQASEQRGRAEPEKSTDDQESRQSQGNPDRNDRNHDLNGCEARTLELPTREKGYEMFRDSEDHEAEETEQREIGRPGPTSEERGESIVADRECVGPHERGQDPENQEDQARDNRQARGEIAHWV